MHGSWMGAVDNTATKGTIRTAGIPESDVCDEFIKVIYDIERKCFVKKLRF